METIELQENIFFIKNFLTSEECKSYINFGNNKGFEEAKVGIEGSQVMNKGIRNNERLLFTDVDLAETLWNRVKEVVPEKMEDYTVTGLNEMFRIYKYTKGQRFKMHRDGSYQRNEQERSFFSFIIYLNDDFEGGETDFRKLFSIKPEEGSALVFHHPYRHEGKELLSGTKYVLRTDIMYKKE